MDTTMTIREIIRKDAQYNPVLRRYALKIMRFMLLDGVNTHVTKIDPTILRLWWREGWHPRRAVRAMAEEGKLSPLDQY